MLYACYEDKARRKSRRGRRIPSCSERLAVPPIIGGHGSTSGATSVSIAKPTVNPDRVAELLFNAMKGWGTDEAAIYWQPTQGEMLSVGIRAAEQKYQASASLAPTLRADGLYSKHPLIKDPLDS